MATMSDVCCVSVLCALLFIYPPDGSNSNIVHTMAHWIYILALCIRWAWRWPLNGKLHFNQHKRMTTKIMRTFCVSDRRNVVRSELRISFSFSRPRNPIDISIVLRREKDNKKRFSLFCRCDGHRCERTWDGLRCTKIRNALPPTRRILIRYVFHSTRVTIKGNEYSKRSAHHIRNLFTSSQCELVKYPSEWLPFGPIGQSPWRHEAKLLFN